MDRRRAAADRTRSRILTAARKLLTARAGAVAFSIDAVAQRAGVARMTVYYQFGSKMGLVEALFDDLAARGQISRVAEAFANPEPRAALAGFIAVLGRFFGSDRRVLRRIRALAALDPDFERVMRARDERRRGALRALLARLGVRYGPARTSLPVEALDLLYALTSFESFDSLAGTEREIEAITPVVVRLAQMALGMDKLEGMKKVSAVDLPPAQLPGRYCGETSKGSGQPPKADGKKKHPGRLTTRVTTSGS